MHVYVQKSTSTTRPRSAAAVSGSELSQTVAPSSANSAPCDGEGCVVAIANVSFGPGRVDRTRDLAASVVARQTLDEATVHSLKLRTAVYDVDKEIPPMHVLAPPLRRRAGHHRRLAIALAVALLAAATLTAAGADARGPAPSEP